MPTSPDRAVVLPGESRDESLFERTASCTLDPAGTITSWHAGAARMTGYAEEEILGRHISTFFDPEHVAAGQPYAAVAAAREAGQWVGETWCVRKDGRRFWAQHVIQAFTDEDEQVLGFVTVIHDLTGRKRAHEALRDSEIKFRVLAEESPVGIAMLQEGVYTYANPELARIYGYSVEEIIGSPPKTFFHPEDQSSVEAKVHDRLTGVFERAHYEARIVRGDGQVRRVEIFGDTVIFGGRRTIIGSVVDVTEKRRYNHILRAQEEERVRLGKDLHDGIGSQLTGIRLLLKCLEGRYAVGADVTDLVRRIRALVSESSKDVRRISRGLSPGVLSSGSLTDALERLALGVDGVRCEVTEQLPYLSERMASHLYWIAQEALANARKHAAADSITIRLLERDQAVILEIEDDGRGFDLAGVPTAEGLGLETMEHRAQALGAELLINTTPGAGTHVVCRLPVQTQEDPKSEISHP